MEPRPERGEQRQPSEHSRNPSATTYPSNLPMNQPPPRSPTSATGSTAMNLELGIVLALACAFVANLGFFYKYRGANDAAKVEVRHPLRSAQGAVRLGWFALGMVVATGELGAARGRPGAGADVGDPGGARGRDGVHRGDGRSDVRLRCRPPPMDRAVADRRRPGDARADAAGDARRALAVLPGGDDLLRGRPVRARRPVDHGPADGRAGRAPRRDAGRRRGHPVRRVRHRDQGAHGHHRRARGDRRCC